MCRIWNIYMPWHYEEAHIPRSPLPLFVRFPYLFPAFSWLATYCISPASSTWYLRHIHPAKFARPEKWYNKTLQNILFLFKTYFYLKQEPQNCFPNLVKNAFLLERVFSLLNLLWLCLKLILVNVHNYLLWSHFDILVSSYFILLLSGFASASIMQSAHQSRNNKHSHLVNI